MPIHIWRSGVLLMLLSAIAGTFGACQSSPMPSATSTPDATEAAARRIIDTALSGSVTSTATVSLSGQNEITPIPTATRPPAVEPSATPSFTPPTTHTMTPDPSPTPTITPDAVASATADAARVATIVAATLAAQPTPTPNYAATQDAQERQMATAVAATLTAQPTATPNLAATQAAQEAKMATAVAATLTAQPQPTSTRQPTVAPTPRPTATRAAANFSIGLSTRGNSIEVVEIGQGRLTIIFVGGLHAGSAPSTVDLANRAARYFSENPQEVPADVTLSFVLNANPDARRAPGELAGRLNANNVDLNRNWDCEWQTNAKWRDKTVSGGSRPLSEPETQALADYILSRPTVAVVFWEAKIENGQVSAGGCGDRTLVSQPLAETYGWAASYGVEPWSWYPVNGDASNWLDSQGIPAASVLMLDYERVDWENNLRGIRAVLDAYGR